jgi:hypothetical protein
MESYNSLVAATRSALLEHPEMKGLVRYAIAAVLPYQSDQDQMRHAFPYQKAMFLCFHNFAIDNRDNTIGAFDKIHIVRDYNYRAVIFMCLIE